jgi:predicted MPP superfamily phosphohydrolase
VDEDVRGSENLRRAAAALGLAAGALAAWSLWEAQWIEFRRLEIAIPGLPPALDGFRIVHLSDFHLGTVSLNGRTTQRAVAWAAERDPDLVAITGDLVSRRRGKAVLERVLETLRARYGVYAVLGNHDIDETRDPFNETVDLSDLGPLLLGDESRSFAVGDVEVQVVGVAPRSFRLGASRPAGRIDRNAGLRILLCHYPEIFDRLPEDPYHLILAGHLHGGQICIPSPWGKLHLEHLAAPYWEGVFERGRARMHVSRGLGSSFVPFRFLARPDAAELTLRVAD